MKYIIVLKFCTFSTKCFNNYNTFELYYFFSRQSEAFSNEESQSQTSMVSSASLQLAGDAALSNVNSAMSATGERIEGGATTTATSITANATGLSSAKKPKKKKMEVCISEE